jgi:hypothetical protein
MKQTKEITAKEYAKISGCTEQNVTKHIRNEKWEYLPHVIRIKRFSRFVVLEVPNDLTKDSFKDLMFDKVKDKITNVDKRI